MTTQQKHMPSKVTRSCCESIGNDYHAPGCSVGTREARGTECDSPKASHAALIEALEKFVAKGKTLIDNGSPYHSEAYMIFRDELTAAALLVSKEERSLKEESKQ